MAVYIFQENEPFIELARRMREEGVSKIAQAEVRRPVRGLQVSKDTYAYLKVVDSEGRTLPFVNSGSMGILPDQSGVGQSPYYSNFLLQKVTIARSELKQFVKTFGLTYLFLFGENPITINVEGALVHSADFPWDEEWWVNYENTLRATRLAEMGARVYLTYEGYLIEGYILSAGTSREAMVKHMVPLGFEMVATNIKFLSKVGQTDFPIYSSVVEAQQPGLLGEINKYMPSNRVLQFANQTEVGMMTSGLAMGASVMQFGTFGNMMQYFAKAPWLLAGMSAPPLEALKAVEMGLNQVRMGRFKAPPLRTGKIRLNTDEYVTGVPAQDPFIEAESRMSRFQSLLEPTLDSASFGSIIGQITVFESQISAVGGNDTETTINMATVDGLGQGSGVACLPDRQLDIPPEGAHLTRGDSPWSGSGATPT
jgi:hypothetical protein